MSTQEIETVGEVERSAALIVRDVVQIVQEWVDLYASKFPGFAGAYTWGGITAMEEDASFPLYRDVDVVVVVPDGSMDETTEVYYRGVMLEVIAHDPKAHQDVEAVLANPSHGPNMATTKILADPTGELTPFRQAVAAQYKKRRWIQARCDAERVMAEKHLAEMRTATTTVERRDSLWQFMSALSGMLAVAQLKRPTTRRTLSLLGEMLDEQGRHDLRERALEMFGSAHMERGDVQAMLDLSVAAFDRSVEVYKTPTPYGFTIEGHLRPYLSEATQEMIDEENHREAMFWLVALAGESYLVLENDAPDEEKGAFGSEMNAIHDALGYTSAELWAGRVEMAERLAQEIYGLADGLTARNPE